MAFVVPYSPARCVLVLAMSTKVPRRSLAVSVSTVPATTDGTDFSHPPPPHHKATPVSRFVAVAMEVNRVTG